MALIQDQDLVDVLMSADADDISVLIDLITDNGKGRVSLSSDVCRRLTVASQTRQIDEESRALVAEELKRFGGNSLVNFLRGGAGVSYKEIASDVASHVKAPHNHNSDCLQIELAIIEKVLEQSLEKMSEDERKAFFESVGQNYIPGAGAAAMAVLLAVVKLSGLGAFQMTTIVANATAVAMVGRGLVLGAQAGAMRGIGLLAGPVGWALAAIWTAFDLASPAYRVTVPCVIQIAYMRRKALLSKCPSCDAEVIASAKFCSECGERLGDPTALLTSD